MLQTTFDSPCHSHGSREGWNVLTLVEAKPVSSFSKCSQQSEGYQFHSHCEYGPLPLAISQTTGAFSLAKLFGLGRSVDMSGVAWTCLDLSMLHACLTFQGWMSEQLCVVTWSILVSV